MKAKELLSRREAWTRGVIARNASGQGVPPLDPSAVSWCIVGALVKCYNLKTQDYYMALSKLDTLLANRGGQGLTKFDQSPGMYTISFNENVVYEDVIALLNEADV